MHLALLLVLLLEGLGFGALCGLVVWLALGLPCCDDISILLYIPSSLSL